MGNLLNDFKYIDSMINYHLNGSTENVVFNDNILLRKPIGIGTKSYGFMEAMLHRNIGSHHFQYDGFGTIIGMQSNPFLNSETDPWFFLDESKKKYDNYLSYVNDMYFHGTMLPPNIQNTSIGFVQLNDYNAMLDEISRVGAIHHYDIDNIAGARMFIPNGSTNANGYDDTRLGVINNFYLSASLNNSYDKTLMRNTSSYHKPTYGKKEDIIENSYSVTQGAYYKFGLKGEYGIKNSTFGAQEGVVMHQNLLTDDIILWSTAENYYTSNGNNERIGNMLGIEMTEEMMDNGYGDSKRVGGYKSYPFGNFYSLSYSLGLLSASGSKTKEFIAKSMYGVDLLSNFNPSLDYNKGDITTLKKISRKKYFASIGSRGTNYIDAMTGIDVEFENGDDGIIRLHLQDAGNDNLYVYNTFLIYSEAEGNKEPVTINSPIGNEGINIGKFQTYDENILSKEDIISYTNRQFQQNKFKTIIGRLHTDSFLNANDARIKKDFTSTAVSQFGMSRGRNLLKKDYKNKKTDSGFEDPYCRVWTYEKQYSKYSDLIRPFGKENINNLNNILKSNGQIGRDRLKDYGVKDENGFLRITPNNKIDITKCMFSIENLAWRDTLLINDAKNVGNQFTIGPNGGRIMWFPPYNLTFQEQSKANWNASQFIGRGEKIYSYVDTERTGSLSFTMLIDHPSLLNVTHNVSSDSIGDVDDVNSVEQQLLRFFAGCDILSAQTSNQTEQTEMIIQSPTPVITNGIVEQYHIEFDVYFPYNLGGLNINDKNDLIYYLINGIGCEWGSDTSYYSLKKNSTKMVGGYEMEGECGLSCTEEWSEEQDYGGYGYCFTSIYEEKDKEKSLYTDMFSRNSSGETEFWGHKIDNYLDKNNNQEDVSLNDYKSFLSNKNIKQKNYLDIKTYHLNSEKNKKKKKESVENCLDISFADMAVFLGCKVYKDRKNKITTKETQKLLQNIFDKYKVSNIELNGYAIEGEIMAKERMVSVQDWLLRSKIISKTAQVVMNNKEVVQSEKLKKDINSQDSKKARKVNVVITLEREILDLQMDYLDGQTNLIIQNIRNNASNISNTKNTMEYLVLSNINEYNKKNSHISGITNSQNNIQYKEKEFYNEYEFFQQINSENPFLRNKVLDKIKYFDPAYHSMTPEGFNGRLTFLHQCTRQGPTNSWKDNNVNIRNLSFGQPPICVLRIGDFYNTKIVIDSVNIKYDETMWDLNDEGIGVMPMMADIDISFSFIGGSELCNAVSILQNAVSFNYYANTSVYENKSIKVKKKENTEYEQ